MIRNDGWKDVLTKQNYDSHNPSKSLPFILLHELTRSVILCESYIWFYKMAMDILCKQSYSIFKISFQPYLFYSKHFVWPKAPTPRQRLPLRWVIGCLTVKKFLCLSNIQRDHKNQHLPKDNIMLRYCFGSFHPSSFRCYDYFQEIVGCCH